jgi:hypothetical protein
MRRRLIPLLLLAGAVAVVAALGGGVGTRSAHATSWYDQLPQIQKRILSGQAALMFGPNVQLAPRVLSLNEEDAEGDEGVDVTTTPLTRKVTCPSNFGDNFRVNQNCLNIADPDLQGRDQAQNETAIASNPNNRRQLVGSYNDYRRGDGTCGVSYSNDGTHWKDATTPNGFTRGTAFGDKLRQYWQAGGDTAVAWDTRGNVYLLCQTFMRGSDNRLTNNPDQSSALYLFRSTEAKGASWDFPARPIAENDDTQGVGNALLDKPYMTVDNHRSSHFRDRVYVSWTFFAPDRTAYIYEAFSDDYGESFSNPVVVSKDSDLCTNDYGLPTPHGRCNQNQFSQPFTGPDGALYVVYNNYNNTVSGDENWNQVLVVKSTDGGKSFGKPVLVSKYYDLPDCSTYQNHQDPGRACVPEKGSSTNSIFRATNYPSGVADPTNPDRIAVTFGSYINEHSNESNGCMPAGLAPTGLNAYTGVKTAGACNNDILVSVSTNGGKSFTGTNTDPRDLTSVDQDPAQATTDQFWQWAAISDSGRLYVSSFDRQYGDDETTGNMDVSVSASEDLTAFATARATTTSMPLPTQFPNSLGNSQFFGDYTGLDVSGANDNLAMPIWPDTRNQDLFLCDGTGQKGVPPQLCGGTEPNGLVANDQDIYTAGVHVP